MSPRTFALVSGVAYLLLGIVSLVPAASTHPADLPSLHLETSYGLFLGLFAQNIVNKIAILVFGAAGLAAYFSRDSLEDSVLYARMVFVVMGVAALLGVLPSTSTFFGYWPLWGYEAVLHGANALIGGYFGFLAVKSTLRWSIAPHHRHV